MGLIASGVFSNVISDLLTKENITLIIAMWGAILSTYKLVSDYRKNKRKIKVKIGYGFLSRGNEVGPNILSITAVNMGYRDVTLSSMGFLLPSNIRSIIVEPQSSVRFPHTLHEGRSCSVWKERIKFAEELEEHGISGKIKIRGYFVSETGETYQSKPVEFDTKLALEK